MPKADFVYASVAVNRPLRQTFVYKVPGSHGSEIIGARVRISFSGSTETGVITGILPQERPGADPAKIKAAELLDPQGLISPDLMQTLEFGSRYYHCPIGQVCWTALPKKLRDGEPCSYEKIPALKLSAADPAAALKRTRSKDQLQLLEILKDGPVRRKELRERGFSAAAENALIKKGLAEKTELEAPAQRWQEHQGILLRECPPVPGDEQQAAIDEICNCKGFGAFVLDGVTGSGKTEVYLRIIEQVLRRGKAALVLVPQIALTPQTFERFYRRFSVPVSSMHSQLNDRERLDAYIDMKSSHSGILIGTRTALFTPIPDLGLIVLDEEHDSSFKQTDGFRYHARSLALVRARLCGCPVILGSATPSLESFYNCECGRFKRIVLKNRAGGASMPDFQVADLRKEPLTDGLRAGIGQTLEDRIGEETAKGNQVLLFLNRRGYSHHLLCHSCGHVFVCPHCDNPLTVHRLEGRLKCHVCEFFCRIPEVCPSCGQASLMETGFGTEKTEEYLKLRYPDLRIERIDRDTVTTKAQLEERLSRIRSGESSILLGTQMVAKGHDFPNVTLVGIIDLDSNLFSDDYRALEYTAQLLTQVSGRAGRALKRGSVIIQTHHPDNELIAKITDPSVSYAEIAEGLLAMRRRMNLPPCSSQTFLLCSSPDREKAFYFLSDIWKAAQKLRVNYPQVSFSPVLSDKMEKRVNRFHFHMLLSSPDRRALSAFTDEIMESAGNTAVKGDVRFAAEVDPIIMY